MNVLNFYSHCSWDNGARGERLVFSINGMYHHPIILVLARSCHTQKLGFFRRGVKLTKYHKRTENKHPTYLNPVMKWLAFTFYILESSFDIFQVNLTSCNKSSNQHFLICTQSLDTMKNKSITILYLSQIRSGEHANDLTPKCKEYIKN